MNTTILEKDIKNLYRRLGIYAPLYELDMQEICQTLSVSLIFWESSSKACTHPNGRSYIFINQKQNILDQWYDFAHELGHVIRHNGCQIKMPDQFIFYQEKQANLFAEHFLVPSFILDQLPLPNDRALATLFILEHFPVRKELAKRRLSQWYNKKIQQEADSFVWI